MQSLSSCQLRSGVLQPLILPQVSFYIVYMLLAYAPFSILPKLKKKIEREKKTTCKNSGENSKDKKAKHYNFLIQQPLTFNNHH